MKCGNCGFEADRDTIAVLNIEKKTFLKMGGSLTTPTAPQMKDVIPNRCGEPLAFRAERRSDKSIRAPIRFRTISQEERQFLSEFQY